MKLTDLYKRSRSSPTLLSEDSIFRKKYSHFRNLLSENRSGMQKIAELVGLIYGHVPFTL